MAAWLSAPSVTTTRLPRRSAASISAAATCRLATITPPSRPNAAAASRAATSEASSPPSRTASAAPLRAIAARMTAPGARMSALAAIPALPSVAKSSMMKPTPSTRWKYDSASRICWNDP